MVPLSQVGCKARGEERNRGELRKEALGNLTANLGLVLQHGQNCHEIPPAACSVMSYFINTKHEKQNKNLFGVNGGKILAFYGQEE